MTFYLLLLKSQSTISTVHSSSSSLSTYLFSQLSKQLHKITLHSRKQSIYSYTNLEKKKSQKLIFAKTSIAKYGLIMYWRGTRVMNNFFIIYVVKSITEYELKFFLSLCYCTVQEYLTSKYDILFIFLLKRAHLITLLFKTTSHSWSSSMAIERKQNYSTNFDSICDFKQKRGRKWRTHYNWTAKFETTLIILMK